MTDIEIIEDLAVTIDVDWMPDFMIDILAHELLMHEVKTTWFITHTSLAIERLKDRSDIFELGIHPNFLAGSSHGNTEDEVMCQVKELLPDAVSMRTHGLYQSSGFYYKVARDYNIKIDASILLPYSPGIVPHKFEGKAVEIVRIPCFWEDDLNMYSSTPLWHMDDTRLLRPGLKIFNFHPAHVVLNSIEMKCYEYLKSQVSVAKWHPEFIAEHINKKFKGTGVLFKNLVAYLAHTGKSRRMIDIYEEFHKL